MEAVPCQLPVEEKDGPLARIRHFDHACDCSWRALRLLTMQVTVQIPDDLAPDLGVEFKNLGQAALEALASEAYERDVLSLEQVRRLLGLGSRWEAQAVLSRHGAWPGQSAEDVLKDAECSARFRTARG